MTSPGVEIAEHPPEFNKFNRCSCGQKIVLINGRPMHLDEWLAVRPQDND